MYLIAWFVFAYINFALSSFVKYTLYLDLNGDKYYIRTQLSKHKQESKSYIDFSKNYSIIKENRRYNAEPPTTIKLIHNKETDSNEFRFAQDTIMIEELLVSNFVFLLEISFDGTNYDDYPIPSIISFSRSESSLMSQLYQSGLISKKIIYFSTYSMLLGYNAENTNELYHYTPLSDYHNQWSTVLLGVITGVMNKNETNKVMIDIGNYSNFNQSFPLIFDSNEIGVVFPVEYFDFFYFGYFELFISLHKCFLKIKNNDKVFECDRSTLAYFDDMFFFFHNRVMVKFKAQELFYSLTDWTIQSKISFRESLQHVSIGMEYILTKSVVFNEESKLIGFKDSNCVYKVNNNFEWKNNSNNDITAEYCDKLIVVINLCDLFFGLILLIVTKTKITVTK